MFNQNLFVDFLLALFAFVNPLLILTWGWYAALTRRGPQLGPQLALHWLPSKPLPVSRRGNPGVTLEIGVHGWSC